MGGRKTRQWFRAPAAARSRARRGRRRGQARSASRRKILRWELPPASKCTASSRPPKARITAKPLMMLDNNFTFREIVGHHNGFWAEGETGSSSPLPLWERVQGGLRPPSLEQDADASASAGQGESGKIRRVAVRTATRRTRS